MTDDEFEANEVAEPAVRPNGSALLVGGWTLLCAGVVALGVGLLLPTTLSGGYTGDAIFNPFKPALIWGGGGAAQLGLVLLLAGWIVRAIFFLPGRVVTKGEMQW